MIILMRWKVSEQPTTSIMLEVATYLNLLIADLVDSSGVRYFYTDEPPEIRAGIFPVGSAVIGHMLIPPNVERYTVTAYCSMNCTEAVSM